MTMRLRLRGPMHFVLAICCFSGLGWFLEQVAVQGRAQRPAVDHHNFSMALDDSLCHFHNATNISATTSRFLCDPHKLLSKHTVQLLDSLMTNLEATPWTCQGEIIPIQVGAYLNQFPTVNIKNYGMLRIRLQQQNEALAIAQQIHEQWHLGYDSKCGNSGILLYLSVHNYINDNEKIDNKNDDTVLIISRGKAFQAVVSDYRLHLIQSQMTPLLQRSHYGEALQFALLEITQYIQGNYAPAINTIEADNVRLVLLFGMFMVVLPCSMTIWILVRCCLDRQHPSPASLSAYMERQRLELEKKLRQMEYQLQLQLFQLQQEQQQSTQTSSNYSSMGVYMAKSCPICLDDFPPMEDNDETNVIDKDNNKNNNERKLKRDIDSFCWEETPLLVQAENGELACRCGNDGKPLMLLPCGHIFDDTCLVEWILTQQMKKIDLTCPVCLHPLELQPTKPTCSGMVD